MRNARPAFDLLAVLSICLLANAASAAVTLSVAQPQVRAGQPFPLEVTITNDGGEPLELELPNPMHLRLETAAATSVVPFQPDRFGPIVVAPREFRRIVLK